MVNLFKLTDNFESSIDIDGIHSGHFKLNHNLHLEGIRMEPEIDIRWNKSPNKDDKGTAQIPAEYQTLPIDSPLLSPKQLPEAMGGAFSNRKTISTTKTKQKSSARLTLN